MDIKAYISSSILELYVYGSLSEKESQEVYKVLQEYPEAVEEVERIEKTLQQLSSVMVSPNIDSLYNKIESQLEQPTDIDKVVPINRSSKNWAAYIGWAASAALLIGLFIQFNKNQKLQQQVVTNQIEQNLLEGKINVAEEDLSKVKSLLNVLRNKDIIQIPLKAQQVDLSAYATVYWDKEKQTTYIDVAGLPTPSPGKVYQIWSLKLDPLTPTSLGVLNNFSEDDQKIFSLKNPNKSEAFGITLEPEGGSESPTLEQLYTLGIIDS